MHTEICLVCGSNQIAEALDEVPLKVCEFERTMQMRFTECAACGCSFHTAEQEHHNKQQRFAFSEIVGALAPTSSPSRGNESP